MTFYRYLRIPHRQPLHVLTQRSLPPSQILSDPCAHPSRQPFQKGNGQPCAVTVRTAHPTDPKDRQHKRPRELVARAASHAPYSFRNGTPLVFPVSPHLLLLLPLIAKIQSLAILPTRPPNSPRLKLFWGRKNRKQDTPPEEPRRISGRSMLPPSHRAVTQQEPPTSLLLPTMPPPTLSQAITPPEIPCDSLIHILCKLTNNNIGKVR